MSAIAKMSPFPKTECPYKTKQETPTIKKIFNTPDGCTVSAPEALSYEDILIGFSQLYPEFSGNVYKIYNHATTLLVGSIKMKNTI